MKDFQISIEQEIQECVAGFIARPRLVSSFCNDSQSIIAEYNKRQIFEMLQNVDDQMDEASLEKTDKCCLIEFNIPKRTLCFKNQGMPFSDEGIKSIMLPHTSPKKKLGKTTIGNKGLGFRSLLNWKPDEIVIRSNGVSLTFSLQVISEKVESSPKLKQAILSQLGDGTLPMLAFPQIANDDGESGWVTEIELKWKAQGQAIGDVFADIERELRSFKSELMLFLPRLLKVEIRIITAEGADQIEFVSEEVNGASLKVADEHLYRKSITQTVQAQPPIRVDWLVYRDRCELNDVRIEKDDSKNFNLAIAVPLDEKVRSSLDGVLYNYLPVKSAEQAVVIDLPCLIHATVKLKASRDALMPDDEANKYIFAKILPKALGEFAALIKEHGEILGDKWFPYRLLSPTAETRNLCVKSLYDALRNILSEGEYCPCVDGNYRKIGSCWNYSFAEGRRTQVTDFFNEHKFLSKYVLSVDGSRVPDQLPEFFCPQQKLAAAINGSIKNAKLTDEQLAKLIAVLIQMADRSNDQGKPYASVLRDADGYFDIDDDVYTPPSEDDAKSIAKPSEMVIGFISKDLWKHIRIECGFEDHPEKWDKPRDFVNNELNKVVSLRYYDFADITRNIVRWGIGETHAASATAESKRHAVTEMLKAMLKNFDPKAVVEEDDYRRRMDIPLLVRHDGSVLLAREFLFDSAKPFYAGSTMPEDIFLSTEARQSLFGEAAVGRDVDAFLLSIGVRADVRVMLHELRREDEYISFLRQLEKGSGKEQLNGGLPDGSGNPLPANQYVPMIFDEDVKILRKFPVDKILGLFALQQKTGLLNAVEKKASIEWTIANKWYPGTLYVDWTYIAWQLNGVLDGVILENSKEVEDFKYKLDDKIQPVGLALDALVKLGARRRLVDLSPEELYDQIASFDLSKQRGVQKFYQRIRMAIRQRIAECEKEDERKSLESRCAELAAHKLPRLYARKGDGPVELIDRQNIYYWDNDVLSRKILDDYYKLEIGCRVGAESVRKLFGVNLLGADVVTPVNGSREDLQEISQALAGMIRDRRLYLLTARHRDVDSDDLFKSAVKALKDVSIEVVRKCSYDFKQKRYDMASGEIIQVNREEHKFILCTDALTLKEAIANPRFCLALGELFCVLFSLTGTQIAGEFRTIMKSSLDELELYYRDDNDENELDVVREALGLGEDEERFWASVVGRDLTDQEKIDLSEQKDRRYCVLQLVKKQDEAGVDLLHQMSDMNDEGLWKFALWVGIAYANLPKGTQERIFNFYLRLSKELRVSYVGAFAQTLRANLEKRDVQNQENYCDILHQYLDEQMSWFVGGLNELLNSHSLPTKDSVLLKFIEIVGSRFDVGIEKLDPGVAYPEAPKANAECCKMLKDAGLSPDNLPAAVQSKLFFETPGITELVKFEIDKIVLTGMKDDPVPVDDKDAPNQDLSATIKDIVRISDLQGASTLTAHTAHDGNPSAGKKKAVAYKTDHQKHLAGLRAQQKAWTAMLKEPQRFQNPIDRTSLTGDQGIGNDACHYDFSYIDADGKRRYVEVKSFDEGVFYMSAQEYEFAHNAENRDCYDLMLVVGDDVQFVKAPFSVNSDLGKHIKIIEESWKGFAVR